MKILAQNKAITVFSPIGNSKEHALSMQGKFPNPNACDVGQKRKRFYDCAAPEREKTDRTVCAAKQNKSVNKSANITFGGFFSTRRFIHSEKFKKCLEFAADNGALFAAGIALATTVFLRPFAIFATPGVKKENKEYACAKSIASGAIGFGLMALISTPIAKAIKKINDEPSKYLKASTIKNLTDNGKELVKSKKYKLATQTFKLGADFAAAIPKALLMCALIPPIMSLLFPKRKQNGCCTYFKAGNIDNRSSQIFKGFIKKG